MRIQYLSIADTLEPAENSTVDYIDFGDSGDVVAVADRLKSEAVVAVENASL